uniref:Transcription factor Adf-1 n=1 Tax=Eptatretus burgeri TaxID=7764 RepID=A0A8C4R687_EPTBU
MARNSTRKSTMAEKLIRAVRPHPILYEVKHKDYRNVEKKGNTWTSISNKLNIPVKDARRTWKNLRDVYARRNKTLMKECHYSTKKLRPWKYAATMSFLDKYNHQPNAHCNLQSSDEGSDDTPKVTVQRDEAKTESWLESPAVQTPVHISRTPAWATKNTNSHWSQQADPVILEILSQLKNDDTEKVAELQRELGRASEHDLDELYLLSLGPAVKSLNPETKSIFKMHMQGLLHELKFGSVTS